MSLILDANGRPFDHPERTRLLDATGAPIGADDETETCESDGEDILLIHLEADTKALLPYGTEPTPQLVAALRQFVLCHPGQTIKLSAEEVDAINATAVPSSSLAPEVEPDEGRSTPPWGTAIKLTNEHLPDGMPREGWRMGHCNVCNRGSKADPRPVLARKRQRICPPCLLQQLQPAPN